MDSSLLKVIQTKLYRNAKYTVRTYVLGHVWKGLRKNLNHSFGKAIVSDVARTFNTKSTILVENLEKYAGQGEHDLSNDFVKCFLDTILSK